MQQLSAYLSSHKFINATEKTCFRSCVRISHCSCVTLFLQDKFSSIWDSHVESIVSKASSPRYFVFG